MTDAPAEDRPPQVDPLSDETPPQAEPPTRAPAREGQSPWWIVGASFTGLAMGVMLAGGLIGVLEASEARALAPRLVASAGASLAAPVEASTPDLEADPEAHGDEVLDEAVDVDASAADPTAALPPDTHPDPHPDPHPRHDPARPSHLPPVPPAPRGARVTSDDVPEGPVQGYIRGRAIRIVVTRIDGKPVELQTAHAYRRMRDAAARAGVQLRIVSGFRTMEHQQALYRAYRRGRGNLAAVPGTSNHQSGHALDLNTSSPGVLRWLDRHARSFGFRRTVPTESWHWEHW
ncbi:MAG: M15 family metallopeptidase [Polyangiales bacterium]